MAPHATFVRFDGGSAAGSSVTTLAAQTSLPASAARAAELSIVIPVYRGANTVERLANTLIETLGTTYRLQIVLVNDGSPDNSAEVCRRLARSRSEVSFVNLSRNFSEHNAVMAGLNHAVGEWVVIMDDDFQNPPSEVTKLVDALRQGYDVAFSYYETKQHHPFRNIGSRFNNLVASIMLDKPRDLYLSSFKGVNRFVVDEIIKHDGPYPYIDGLIWRVTHNYTRVMVSHDKRVEGKSGYTLRKLVSLWLNMFTSFSVLPLRFASAMGFLFAFAGLAIGAWCVVEKLFYGGQPDGWASVIVSLLVIGGVQLFALGIIGEYVGRLFLKQNGRPQFIVRERVNFPPSDTPRA